MFEYEIQKVINKSDTVLYTIIRNNDFFDYRYAHSYQSLLIEIIENKGIDNLTQDELHQLFVYCK